MHCFYVNKDQILEDRIKILGEDVNHIKNVLRKSLGEQLLLCDKEGLFYTVQIDTLDAREIWTRIQSIEAAKTELPTKIYLFQALPKKDKMELIIQKAVELGVYEVIPVASTFCVMKLEDKKKEQKKIERWQAISEAAAKQSGRGIIPSIHTPVSFKEAITMAGRLDAAVIPYENAEGIKASKEAILNLSKKTAVGIFIGPEGGFSTEEIELAKKASVDPITLGKRILRTETAGFTILSLLMFEIEQNSEK
ncbi:MAG: rRNA (uracil1498-N3)-methyltransferase [Clostridiales bacterium]|nr:rRNA (uracil1498-N3)-methyltransferase [Clostridiales bacterium]